MVSTVNFSPGSQRPVLRFEAKLGTKKKLSLILFRENRQNLQSRVSEGSLRMKEAVIPSHPILLEEEPEGQLCASSQLH